ncbi:hypothetical protein HPB48_021595 [Haemaphysalis longicornis]|uniref:Peptidase M13 C-terminal domain-containing protein n=1 Tax=Haemaphysalis longicornis TaxID=44386 RepID=A0A9J6FVJ7_HAELO|nr:hypothetical protein HPB48_021595 [Haemaphysalis longicornis]
MSKRSFRGSACVVQNRPISSQVAGYALARLFSESLQLGDAIAATNRTWQALRNATQENFAKVKWMDASTAAGAVGHVAGLAQVIAMPEHLKTAPDLDQFHDYLPEFSQPFLQSWLSAAQRRSDKYKRLLDTDGTVHREDFELPLTGVNAFYFPVFHIMAMLPGIMMPPFLSLQAPETVNYGAIGKILGHELTHSFDPSFSVDRTGGKINWYTKQSMENSLKGLSASRNSWGAATDYVHASNALSETFADTAGTEKAYLAYQTLAAPSGLLGYSPEQLFFIAGCFIFCAPNPYSRADGAIYPPFALRCNLPASNAKQFAQAFQCPAETWFNPHNRCDFMQPENRTLTERATILLPFRVSSIFIIPDNATLMIF